MAILASSTPHHVTARLALAAALAAGAACAGDKAGGNGAGSEYGGTLVVARPSDVVVLYPPAMKDLGSRAVAEVIFEPLASITPELSTVGDRGFTPRLADRWTWAADSMSIAFHVDPRAKWQDGQRVTSKDVQFTLGAYKEPGTLAGSNLARIDSVSTPDSATAVFWFKERYPQQFYDAVYHMLMLPEHLLASIPAAERAAAPFARSPIGSGSFRFARWVAGAQLEVVADTTNWRGRPKLDRVIWSVTPDPNAAVTRVLSGDADFGEPVSSPAQLAEISKHPELRIATLPGASYAAMQFNLHARGTHTQPHPIFGDVRLRTALTMAIDRQKMVRSVFDSLAAAAVGPMTRLQPTSDTTLVQIPYDVDHAKSLLDTLGWRDTNGDGVRDRGGKPLEFTAMVPNTSRGRQAMAVIIQAALKDVGVQMEIETVDNQVSIRRLDQRDFEVFLNGFSADPSPAGLRDTWGPKGGLNFGDYANPTFIANVDSGIVATDPAVTKRYFRRAYETIIADAPAIWLYELKTALVVHRRFQTVGMRPDAWWARLDEWTVPADQRIDRDRIGLRVANR
jgi:peptide/nickel transport system substrate-binding protein